MNTPTTHKCIVCGTKLFTDENLSACAHGLRCEICTTQNAECVACVKAEDLSGTTTEDLKASLDRWARTRNLGGDTREFAIAVAMELQSRVGLNAYTNRLMVWLRDSETEQAELVPNSPERLAMIARVMDGHTSMPLGASIPGTKAPQGYWPLRDLLLRKIAQGRALGMFRADFYTTEANHQNTVAHAGELFAQIMNERQGA